MVNIAAHTFLCKYVGDIVRGESNMRDIEDMYKRKGINKFYVFQIDECTFVDATERSDSIGRFFNHLPANKCNCIAAKENDEIGIVTLRDVKMGEQLTYSYYFKDSSLPWLTKPSRGQGSSGTSKHKDTESLTRASTKENSIWEDILIEMNHLEQEVEDHYLKMSSLLDNLRRKVYKGLYSFYEAITIIDIELIKNRPIGNVTETTKLAETLSGPPTIEEGEDMGGTVGKFSSFNFWKIFCAEEHVTDKGSEFEESVTPFPQAEEDESKMPDVEEEEDKDLQGELEVQE
uniref:SET domain-containing protein n=1 Tax=Amphimedon queenslandica TaxID=400682 RepID=A0A1X7TEL9_AMPQE